VLLQLGYTSNSVWYWRWPKDTVNIVNMDGLEWKRTKYNRYVKRFLQYAEKLAADKGDLLIADSLGIKEYLKEKYNKDSVFIPYGAEPFNNPDKTVLQKYSVAPFEYNLLIARLEPENNIQAIIDGHLLSQTSIPLLVVGNTKHKYGQDLLMKYKHNSSLVFTEGIYDKNAIDNLRFFSHLYFHGHSVGGTNPSLLEAMACHALVVAHDNIFNKSILTNDAFYFSNAVDIKNIIAEVHNKQDFASTLLSNTDKITSKYSWSHIVAAYEQAMLTMVQ
jgi:glycosyltransferase involved in cell wall biosynthesis